MQLDTPVLAFIGTAMAIGAVCLSYLKMRFHTTDHHLMIFVVVGAIGYLAPLHIERAAHLERERLKETWAGMARSLAHELEWSGVPYGEVDEQLLQKTSASVTQRLSLPSADLVQAVLVTPQETSYRRIKSQLGRDVARDRSVHLTDPKVQEALQDKEVWNELLDTRGHPAGVEMLVPLRNGRGGIEAVLIVEFSLQEWAGRQSQVQWRVAGEFLGLLSICLLMAGYLVYAGENRRKQEMETAVKGLQAEVESLGGMVNSLQGVVWERPAGSRKFSFVSQQADGALGYPLGRWTAEKGFIEEIILEEDLPVVQCRWATASRKCGGYRIEYRVKCADGSVAQVVEQGQAKRLPLQGVILRGILVDVTAQWRAEAAAREMHSQLLEASRQAGMAEVATGVLHNVGNVLNSLNVGAKLLLERLQRSRHDRLCQATSLVKEHLPHDPRFFVEDKRGCALPDYLQDLAEFLRDEQNRLSAAVSDMAQRIDDIRDIILLQQSHSKSQTLSEMLDLATVVEDALRLELSAHGGTRDVQIDRQFADLPPIYLARGLLLQILVNLLSNACHAMEGLPSDQRRLSIRVGPSGADSVRLVIEDNGCGINPGDLTKVFAQGFTTKAHGQGFGLHHASLLADDLGGSLRAESEGQGRGARFILDLPVRTPPASVVACGLNFNRQPLTSAASSNSTTEPP